jgi:hypothetical protein
MDDSTGSNHVTGPAISRQLASALGHGVSPTGTNLDD